VFGGVAAAAEMEIAEFVALAAVGKDAAAAAAAAVVVVVVAASAAGMLLVAVEVSS